MNFNFNAYDNTGCFATKGSSVVVYINTLEYPFVQNNGYVTCIVVTLNNKIK